MKSLVFYDSAFGNTKKIAEAIADELTGEVKIFSIGQVSYSKLKDFDLIIAGSPTQGGRPTQAMSEFLREIPDDSLKGVKFATFDTRIFVEDQNFALRMVMKIIDYASGKMAKVLAEKGGELLGTPEGFIVEGKEGPLRKGEIERAKKWAKEISAVV